MFPNISKENIWLLNDGIIPVAHSNFKIDRHIQIAFLFFLLWPVRSQGNAEILVIGPWVYDVKLQQ